MRMLHTMLRVADLERSLGFYTEVLGMQLLRRKDYPSGRFTLAFVGYGSESDHTVLELTHNWETDSYTLGDAYGHIALGVEDIHSTCAGIADKGGRVVREPGFNNQECRSRPLVLGLVGGARRSGSGLLAASR